MNRTLTNILIALLFLFGIGVFSYPLVSNYLYERAAVEAVISYGEAVDEISPERIAAEKEAVRRYNESLFLNPVVLTEPFDPNSWPATDGEYSELLALTEEMGCIEIPSIDVNLPIYHGTTDDVLEQGVGHLEKTSLPLGGPSTHVVLSAHCGLPKAELFTNLENVQVGDVFRITVLDEVLSYRVYDIEVVEPDRVESLSIQEGRDLVTLVTCTPYGKNTHRLLVHGERTTEPAAPGEAASRALSASQKTPWGLLALAVVACMAAAFFASCVYAAVTQRRGAAQALRAPATPANLRRYSRHTAEYRAHSRGLRIRRKR